MTADGGGPDGPRNDREFALGDPDELSGRERAAVEACLRTLADDEFVLAERYTEWQVRGPTLESDLAVANIAQDELGHARLWYDLLSDFGYAESELIWERPPGDFRHATLVERPVERGDWADAVVRGFLYDEFESLRLEALAETEYPRIADRVGKVRSEEHYHRDHARNWLERLVDDDPSEGGTGTESHRRVQAAVDRLFPHALTLFTPTEREPDIVDLGVRPTPLSELRREWLETVVPVLRGFGLSPPVATDAGAETVDELLPAAAGRDRGHTDAWFDLYDEFTFTYRQLDRDEATRLMTDPDEAADGTVRHGGGRR
ncbi:MAG: 1,2-phenylacetyl-CoA epoxidase subunit PaaC [Haloglomus sp.]